VNSFDLWEACEFQRIARNDYRMVEAYRDAAHATPCILWQDIAAEHASTAREKLFAIINHGPITP